MTDGYCGKMERAEMSYSDRVKCTSCDGSGTTGEHGCTDCLGKGLDHMAFAGGIEQALNDAYAEGRKDEAEDHSRAARDVLAERDRQVRVEGYTPEHDDDHHTPAELARAAICYADLEGVLSQDDHDRIWPWGPLAWKPKHVRRDLVRAAALLLAAIESGDRDGWADFGLPPKEDQRG